MNFLDESACVEDLLVVHGLALVNQIDVAVDEMLSALLVLTLNFHLIVRVQTLGDP